MHFAFLTTISKNVLMQQIGQNGVKMSDEGSSQESKSTEKD